MTAINTSAIVDGAARVIATAINGSVFAAGVTDAVTDVQPYIVPVADDWSEVGFPVVTVVMGVWAPALQPGNERLTMTLNCAVWRERVPLGESTSALYADRDAIADAWIAHTKAYLAEAQIQSAILEGGPGIVPRVVPAGQGARILLSLPFTVEVKCNRQVIPQPA